MKTRVFGSIDDLVETMEQDHGRGLTVSSILFGTETELLIRKIVSNPQFKISFIDYENEIFDYCGEYVATLSNDGFFSVEKLYVDEKYLLVETDICYIDGEANSRLLPSDKNELKKWIEIDFIDLSLLTNNATEEKNYDEEYNLEIEDYSDCGDCCDCDDIGDCIYFKYSSEDDGTYNCPLIISILKRIYGIFGF